MTDNDRQWAALVKAMRQPSEAEKEDGFIAKLTVMFPIRREMFEMLGSEVTFLAMRECMIDGIENAIKEVREAIK